MAEEESYEAWFIHKHGPRPEVERGALDRAIQLRQEADELEEAVERQRRWDQQYMAGRHALDAFGRRDT